MRRYSFELDGLPPGAKADGADKGLDPFRRLAQALPAQPVETPPAKSSQPAKAAAPAPKACQKDEDCAATGFVLGGTLTCCAACKPTAGTRAWVKRVDQICQQRARSAAKPKCAPMDCEKPEIECRAGRCALK